MPLWLGQIHKGVDLHAVGNADAEIVGRAILTRQIVRRGGGVDEQRVQTRRLGLDRQRCSGWIEAGEERNALILDQLLCGFNRGGWLALVILDEELVFAPERAALGVEVSTAKFAPSLTKAPLTA